MRRALAAVSLIVAICGCTSSGGIADATPSASARALVASPPAASPSPKPSATPKPLAVKVVKQTKTVKAGGTASVTVQTKKGAACSITVTYDSQVSEAKGLDDKKANASGAVAWAWKVGSNAHKGKVPVDIACTLGDSAGSAETSFVVT